MKTTQQDKGIVFIDTITQDVHTDCDGHTSWSHVSNLTTTTTLTPGASAIVGILFVLLLAVFIWQITP